MSNDQVGRSFPKPREPEMIGMAARQCFLSDTEYRQYLRRLAAGGARPPARLLVMFDRYCESRQRRA
jgi:hypothetical protein